MRALWFCIPAHGHTNPTMEVVRELTRRGHEVRYYSFEEFRAKIEGAGAQFVACDSFLPPIDEKAEKRLRRVSTTEMSVQSFRTVANLDPVVSEDVATWRPDVVVTDSACFWGKLAAVKHGLPWVCSTTTFAFNEYSSKYMSYSASEMADMVLGLPRLNREIRRLRPLGYEVKSALDIVRNKPGDNTIVYTSRKFQPCSETFDEEHYRFVGPSVRDVAPKEKSGRPLVYASLGTVINDRPGFYRTLINALRDADADLIISCGKAFDPAQLGELPSNVRVEQYVDQMEVLSRTSLFVTHCGMNSASEGMWMGVPELLFPLTGEQRAVARRVTEVGAGAMLEERMAKDAATLREAIVGALEDGRLREGSTRMRDDLRSCAGPAGAADFIEQVARRPVGV
ncbi:Oleandomycin glycosyltransferase [Slackia heliotrinireducens]|uniref:Glycosyltransferase, MGT family n=1 Tax=Slackia heliotrinireducens (strain ATCC 29202 / DSM 20476 / NCTC 11029 / RHS 1) TaxID=471855 RepID=C7N5I9_SLAHD|nr:macrolide family glycosyltransferase [Slackia heliotrinireducens]ACV22174.1 glycosyltransferase, MGT family [Slackia heliotrinireducens DSM 20476]VEH00250.1 Oleandomycin glycosyltransferase [Slackia heliotrinireducens]